jgi:predicted amidophosphoribosyltransferase
MCSSFEETKHIYLIEWLKNESETLDQLVYRLKSNNSKLAIKIYSDLLAEKIKSNIDVKNYEALIPIPGSSETSIHSNLIAYHLSTQLGLKVLIALTKKSDSDTQKKLSAVERKRHNPFQLTHHSPEEFTMQEPVEIVKTKSYIFVDDVLTTGQSFKHGSDTIYWSKRNIIATLFYRTSLFERP